MGWTKVALPILVLIFWEIVPDAGIVSQRILPPLHNVLIGFYELLVKGIPPGHLLSKHIAYSLLRVGLGFAIAFGVALPLGIFMGLSGRIRNFFLPLVEAIRPIPPLAWIPISILWFGIGIKSAAFIIFLGAFFPIISNTLMGVMHVQRAFVEAAMLLGAKRLDLVVKVYLPSAAPAIFTGAKVGLGVAWMTLVAAEFTGIKEGYGLGFMIMTARDIQRPDQIMAGMLVIGVMGFLLNRGISILEAFLVPWAKQRL